MATVFKGYQTVVVQTLLDGLAEIGYADGLVRRNYAFPDWFASGRPLREVAAAAFGQLPVSYDTACFAIVLPGERRGIELINDVRALGAPLAFEVYDDRVVQWKINSVPSSRDQQAVLRFDQLRPAIKDMGTVWSPADLLRAKNVNLPGPRQLELDLGLIPALEQEIRRELDPLLRRVIAEATSQLAKSKVRAAEADLYRLVFWLLASKILHDRNVRGFAGLSTTSDPDEMIQRVAVHYDEPEPLIKDKRVRANVAELLWSTIDFTNLSVEVLAFIYENTLVDPVTRQKQGIHATPPHIARYIVHHLPIDEIPVEERRVIEPCCGTGTLLIAALQRLRELAPLSLDPKQRHAYLKRMLVGYENDPFALEVTRLALMLADFPNPNKWQLHSDDVFASSDFTAQLGKSRIILCNPPYEDFGLTERRKYKLTSVHKPAEILGQAIEHGHPDSMLGFVLPRLLLDGRGYGSVRRLLAERFTEIELVTLPDRVFENADHETVLLMARTRRQSGGLVQILHSKVDDNEAAYETFRNLCIPSREENQSKTADEVAENLAVPDLLSLWQHLEQATTVGEVAKVRRGIEWNVATSTSREKLVSKAMKPGFSPGYANARAMKYIFESPPIEYLNTLSQFQRGNAIELPWAQAKVVMNANTKSRGRWRIAAFPDVSGMICYQTFTCVWPNESFPVNVLAAVLNGFVANAYVASREGKIHITNETIQNIPVPEMSTELIAHLNKLVAEYIRLAKLPELMRENTDRSPLQALREIDVTVLDAYKLPPALKGQLVEYFRDNKRPVPIHYAPHSRWVPYVISSEEILHASSSDLVADTAERLAQGGAVMVSLHRRATSALQALSTRDRALVDRALLRLATDSARSGIPQVYRVHGTSDLNVLRVNAQLRILFSADPTGIMVQDIVNHDTVSRYFESEEK